jgi:hypothetical protein
MSMLLQCQKNPFRAKVEGSWLINGMRTIVGSEEALKILAKELEIRPKARRELEKKVAVGKMDSTKNAEVKVMLPGGNIIGDSLRFALARLSGSARKIHEEGMIAKKSQLVEEVVAIVSMMEKTPKVRVVDKVHLGVDQVGADEGGKGHLRASLRPVREVMEPSAHDGTGDVALRGGEVNPKHTTVLHTVGEKLKKVLAGAIGRETRETIVESLDHFGAKDNALEVAEEVILVEMRKMQRDGVISNPAILGTHSCPGSDGTGGQVNGHRGGLGDAKLVPLLVGGGGGSS